MEMGYRKVWGRIEFGFTLIDFIYDKGLEAETT